MQKALEEEKQNGQEALGAVKENLHQNAQKAVKEALHQNDPKVLEALKEAWEPLRQNAQKTLQAVKEEPEEEKEEKKLCIINYMFTGRFKRLRLCSNDESNPQHTRLAIQCGDFSLENGWITHDDY